MAQIYYCDACSFRISKDEQPIEVDGKRYCGACHRKAIPVRKPPTGANATTPASGSGVRRAAVAIHASAQPGGSGVRRAAIAEAAEPAHADRKVPHKVVARSHDAPTNSGRVVAFAAMALIALCVAVLLLNSGNGNNNAVARRDEKPKSKPATLAPSRVAPEGVEPLSRERLPGPGFLDTPPSKPAVESVKPIADPLKQGDGESAKPVSITPPVVAIPTPKETPAGEIPASVETPAKIELAVPPDPVPPPEMPSKVVMPPEVKPVTATTPDQKTTGDTRLPDPKATVPGLQKEPTTSVPAAVEKEAKKTNTTADAIKALGRIVDRKRLWDGDVVAGGKGWVGPMDGTSAWVVQTQVAHTGKTAMLFHSKSAGWTGGGWNWCGWNPADPGVDATKYSTMAVWIKADWKGAKPDNVWMKLVCSHFKKESTNVDMLKFEPALLNGAWHQVVIPVTEFSLDATKQFDPAKLWQIEIHTFTKEEHDFNIYVDEVELELRKK
jgi:hypothetical protein